MLWVLAESLMLPVWELGHPQTWGDSCWCVCQVVWEPAETPQRPVLSGLDGLALLASPDMSGVVSSLEALLYFGSGWGGGAALWVLGISGVLRRWVGGCSARVKSYDQGEATRGWRVRLGTGEGG